MSGKREPDHTDDPRDVSTGQGYPEEQPGGANPSAGSDGREQGPQDAGNLRQDDPPAPDTGEDEDSGPGTATGNPANAGGG